MFRREGIDQYKGAADDTINVVVEGVLPYRTYGWRNDRSTEIVFDEYKERKVAVEDLLWALLNCNEFLFNH